ncbi:hypothetical protein FOA52_003916 [Chlamydomonas sp. UWO 241]|nr:hypothetical protein FOA52_003916 [Chlamydomonas sp. UWO 241]
MPYVRAACDRALLLLTLCLGVLGGARASAGHARHAVDAAVATALQLHPWHLNGGSIDSIDSSSGSSSSSSGAQRHLADSGSSGGSGHQRSGRNCGSQATHAVPVAGATLFSWGLNEARLGRSGGDHSFPEAALGDLKVISIAGSRHSAIATATGEAWTMGHNDSKAGVGRPGPWAITTAMPGEIWTMGHNDSKGGGGHGSPPLEHSGQLGRPRVEKGNADRAAAVVPELAGKFVVQVITGRYHTLAITDAGEVYSWGLNDWGQLGRLAGSSTPPNQAPCTAGPSCHCGIPERVTALEGIKIVGGSAGRYNNIVFDDKGTAYVWGLDGCGGSPGGTVPDKMDAWQPRKVDGALEGKKIVATDSGYVLWIVATAEGGVYTCNTQDDGYAGTLKSPREPNAGGELGREGSPCVPGQVLGDLQGKVVTAVAAGREHAIVVTADGEAYSWGGRGPLLAGRSGDHHVPGLLRGALEGDKVLFVAGGEYFSLAASEKHVYGWGGNNYHTAGIGKGEPGAKRTFNLMTPIRAGGQLGDGTWRVLGLAAGFQHSLALAAKA